MTNKFHKTHSLYSLGEMVENGIVGSVWSEEHDYVPLKIRLKSLLEKKHNVKKQRKKTSIFPFDVIGNEDQQCDMPIGHVVKVSYSSCSALEEGNKKFLQDRSRDGLFGELSCLGTNKNEHLNSNEINVNEVADTVIEEKLNPCPRTFPSCIMSSKCPGEEVNFRDIKLRNPVGDGLECSLVSVGLVAKTETEIADDFLDELDHIVLKERRRLLLRRNVPELKKPVSEGNYASLSNEAGSVMIQDIHGKDRRESSFSHAESSYGEHPIREAAERNSHDFCKISKLASSIGNTTANGECNKIGLSKKDAIINKSGVGHDFVCGTSDNLFSSVLHERSSNIKTEPMEYDGVLGLDKGLVFTSVSNHHMPVKSEFPEDYCDKVDHMLLSDRIKLLASKKTTNVSGGFKNSKKRMSSLLDSTPMEYDGVLGLDKGLVFTSVSNHHMPVKSEFPEDYCDKVDHMLLSDRIKLLASKKTTNVSGGFKNSKKRMSSLLDSTPMEYDGVLGLDKGLVFTFVSNHHMPVKSEFPEDYCDKVDHMLLSDRIKLLASKKTTNVSGGFKNSKKRMSSLLDSTPIASGSTPSFKLNRSRKKRKTVTDSIETAMEEDAPGLLKVLIDKGVSVNEIKLYGVGEKDEAGDDPLEESFSDLEAVISKIFFQRRSFLKLGGHMQCMKDEKRSYCLSCLVSLVEQARYLQFRKWPVEWGWCRDLQSFIFVFKRHHRIVLERPEYGYATYFFELVDSLSINWQIKRLVTAMKLTSCGRITLIENRSLLVGEDLTIGEARVLMEYGWTPSSGLGTMLNYCERVVHDRRNESSSEWKSKIGKLLMDGYNGGSYISPEIAKEVEFNSAGDFHVKLEI